MANDSGGPKTGARWSRGIAAGSQIIVLFLMGFFGGRFADHAWHTGPWLTVTGILVGFGAGLFSAYRLLAKP